MKREIIRVEPLSTYLEKWKAPTSAVTRHGDTIYVSGLPPFDPATGEVVDAPIERQTCSRANETLPGNSGVLAGERAQVQRLLHVSREVRRRQRCLFSVFSQRPARPHLRERPSVARAFRYRDLLCRSGLGLEGDDG